MHSTQSADRMSNYYEMCPLCDFRLPNANSAVPPPHYPLQHRLVMDAIRSRLANRVLCDVCTNEVVVCITLYPDQYYLINHSAPNALNRKFLLSKALVQCSTCLRNFCANCGMEHQQQVTMELRPSKHSVKPLWEATKVRRTALCQKHPTHALRFYCIACQQVRNVRLCNNFLLG